MYEFKIDSMTCGHCASQVRNALSVCDLDAQVHVDLRNRRVTVESVAPEALLREQLEAAGYPAS